MRTCIECGHELGFGRFCTNCGRPVADGAGTHAWRTDTAERPRVSAPVTDEPHPAATAPAPPPVPAPPPPGPLPRHRNRGHGAWLWLAGFLALALVAGLGAWLLFGGDDEPVAAREPGASQVPVEEESRPTDPPPSTAAEPPESAPAEAGPPEDLARFAEVSAPPPAAPSQDIDGDAVRYEAGNLVDGVPETCWRMPGDGTGESLSFRFDGPVRLTEVGLINGYAKTTSDPRGDLDWYAGNRRVRSVEWTFDDGTVVTQALGDTTDVQAVGLDDVETESVTLRLLEVTAPGPGRASRDYTPISDVRLFGATLT